MIQIYEKLKYEPAVFIGFVLSLLALFFKLINNEPITYDDAVLILSPLGTGLATRRKTISKRFVKDQGFIRE